MNLAAGRSGLDEAALPAAVAPGARAQNLLSSFHRACDAGYLMTAEFILDTLEDSLSAEPDHGDDIDQGALTLAHRRLITLNQTRPRLLRSVVLDFEEI